MRRRKDNLVKNVLFSVQLYLPLDERAFYLVAHEIFHRRVLFYCRGDGYEVK